MRDGRRNRWFRYCVIRFFPIFLSFTQNQKYNQRLGCAGPPKDIDGFILKGKKNNRKREKVSLIAIVNYRVSKDDVQ